MIDESLDGLTSIAVSGNVSLTSTNYVTDQSRRRTLRLTGSPGASYTITIPSVEKFYWVVNQSNASQTIKAGGAGVSVPSGAMYPVICDGTDCVTVSSEAPKPVGIVDDFAGTTAPSGWLMCYGQPISRTTYALLFGAIGTTFGVGDGSTTFNIPDCRGRVIAGQDDMGGSSANRLTSPASTIGGIDGDVMGATGGEEAHVQTEAQLATHTHIQNSHTHSYTTTGSTNQFDSGGNNAIQNSNGATTGATTATNQNTGSSAAFNVVQPTIIMNKIIYAGV
jgi:microcystin-dependent protein